MADESNGLARRISEVVGDKSVSAFAKECGFGESLLRKYLAGAQPNAANLVAVARAGGVTVDWLAVGRLPKYAAELCELLKRPNGSARGEHHVATLMQAFQVLQEWQIENGRFLSADKFLRAAELLVELAGDKPEQVRQHAPQVLRLAA
jgi:transcriptional regulator with XRE-family HTH domain